MSTYLLLRNNKQTGPFTLDELKKMSLKAYDLVWVEGKSAAWRYPGEISEFISFAPPVPEQPFDRFYKKPVAESTGPQRERFQDQSSDVRNEPYRKPGINPNRDTDRNSVYINLPAAEKKLTGYMPVASLIREPIDLNWEDPIREQASVKMPERKGRSKGKALLIGAVILFFSAGMFTGFYISNRRNYYSVDGNPPQSSSIPVKSPDFTQNPPANQSGLLSGNARNKDKESIKTSMPPEQNAQNLSRARKKQGTNPLEKKDSANAAILPAPAANAIDSAKKKGGAEDKMLAQEAKIKAHPQEYLLISTGNYKTGVLGGISGVPVTITNRSGVEMDLVVVTVDYIQHNKKIFKTENLSFHNLAPGATVTGEAPKSSRGVKITYRLTIANSQQIGMFYSSL